MKMAILNAAIWSLVIVLGVIFFRFEYDLHCGGWTHNACTQQQTASDVFRGWIK